MKIIDIMYLRIYIVSLMIVGILIIVIIMRLIG